MAEGEVKVWYRIRKDDRSISLKDVFEKIEEIRKKEPDQDVYFDGDEFAICSRPLPRPPESRPEPRHKEKRKGKQAKLYPA